MRGNAEGATSCGGLALTVENAAVGRTKTRGLPLPRGAVVLGADFQALGLVRSLGRRGVPVYVCSRGLEVARFSRYSAGYFRLPAGGDGALLDFLLDLAFGEGLTGWLLVPNDDEQVEFISRHRHALERVYSLSVPSERTVSVVSDKRLTYRFAVEHEVATPATWNPSGEEELAEIKCPFPAIIKPARRNPFFMLTGKKAFRVDSREELLTLYRKLARLVPADQLLVQELIPGGPQNLFSFAALAEEGEVIAWLTANRRRQHPMDFGRATTFARTVSIPTLECIGRRLLRLLSFSGLCEVEFMKDARDGAYKFLEINARIWGWHALGASAGVDFPYLLYLSALHREVEIPPVKEDTKWVRLFTDLPTVVSELVRGRMSWREVVESYRNVGSDAVYASDDPFPFFMELLLAPYFIRKKLR
ncbi:MAG: ATP-grasp domain-containing protein [Pseudomonadota bacterium]